MGDMVKSFFGEHEAPDIERAGRLLREYLDDKLKAPENVSAQEREQFLRIVQHIPQQENPQLERLIQKVTELFERQTELLSSAELDGWQTVDDPPPPTWDGMYTDLDEEDVDVDVGEAVTNQPEEPVGQAEQLEQPEEPVGQAEQLEQPEEPVGQAEQKEEDEGEFTLNSWEFSGSGRDLREILEQYVGRKITDKSSVVFNASTDNWIRFSTVRNYMISGQRPENVREGVQRYTLHLGDGSAVIRKVN